MANVKPFLGSVFETNAYPHAKTLRTSFVRKLMEAFGFLSGNWDFKGNIFSLGLFDYLTLGIPCLFHFLRGWCERKKNTNVLSGILYYLVQGISVLLVGLRVVFSVVGILAALPIVALVHWIVAKSKEKYEITGMGLQGYECENGNCNGSLTTLGAVLAKGELSPWWCNQAVTHPHKIELIEDPNDCFRVTIEPQCVAFYDCRKQPVKSQRTPFFIAAIEPSQHQAFQGLLHLNYANITTLSEKNVTPLTQLLRR